ncbi:MAG: T9SS type A sorting domain-containing protein [Bacteroidales bacterium]|nr:T9SS type A sorting domain-containing protein [Bacteroidales bacterium]MDY0143044.1 T9SS type A sorting domain-containing protein [Bacteroidales bacterium]
MKKTILILISLFAGITLLQAQNLDRVTLSSGGISNEGISATIGELFVFSINADGISLDAGGQSDEEDTGGVPDLPTANPLQVEQKMQTMVYPNPVEDLLNLQINGLKSETVAFQVFDALGKLVLQQTKSSSEKLYQLKVSELTSGNYYIRGYSVLGENIGEIKFIKL